MALVVVRYRSRSGRPSWASGLEGKIIGRCMQRHRHQKFIRVLNAIGAKVPVRKIVHVILDNAAPFAWTADPDKIIAAVRHGHQALDSIH